MTYSSARGHAPGFHRADNVVDLPQEAALIRELRRLQKCLDQECHQERERFPRAVDLQWANRVSNHTRGAENGTPAKPANGPVDRLLDMLGLNRRNPVTGPEPARQATGICKRISAPRHESAIAPMA